MRSHGNSCGSTSCTVSRYSVPRWEKANVSPALSARKRAPGTRTSSAVIVTASDLSFGARFVTNGNAARRMLQPYARSRP